MLDALLRGLTLRGEPPAWGGGAAASEDVGGDGRVNSLPSFRMGEKRADIVVVPRRYDRRSDTRGRLATGISYVQGMIQNNSRGATIGGVRWPLTLASSLYGPSVVADASHTLDIRVFAHKHRCIFHLPVVSCLLRNKKDMPSVLSRGRKSQTAHRRINVVHRPLADASSIHNKDAFALPF